MYVQYTKYLSEDKCECSGGLSRLNFQELTDVKLIRATRLHSSILDTSISNTMVMFHSFQTHLRGWL